MLNTAYSSASLWTLFPPPCRDSHAFLFCLSLPLNFLLRDFASESRLGLFPVPCFWSPCWLYPPSSPFVLPTFLPLRNSTLYPFVPETFGQHAHPALPFFRFFFHVVRPSLLSRLFPTFRFQHRIPWVLPFFPQRTKRVILFDEMDQVLSLGGVICSLSSVLSYSLPTFDPQVIAMKNLPFLPTPLSLSFLSHHAFSKVLSDYRKGVFLTSHSCTHSQWVIYSRSSTLVILHFHRWFLVMFFPPLSFTFLYRFLRYLLFSQTLKMVFLPSVVRHLVRFSTFPSPNPVILQTPAVSPLPVFFPLSVFRAFSIA